MFTTPGAWSAWTDALVEGGSGFGDLMGPALLAFPLLVLGLSGFETGVSMMPLVAAKGEDDEQRLRSRIRNTRRLLTTAALLMSVYLLSASFVTTVLIPHKDFEAGGAANGRALAFLAHEHVGEAFGTVYDISTILILWFAGASAMAGLVNIVPRYLPDYGMAPEWDVRYARSFWLHRPVHRYHHRLRRRRRCPGRCLRHRHPGHDVLRRIRRHRLRPAPPSAGHHRRLCPAHRGTALRPGRQHRRQARRYCHLGHVHPRHHRRLTDLPRIAATELRADRIVFDPAARQFITDTLAHDNAINIIANRRQAGDLAEYRDKERERRHQPGARSRRRPVPGN